MDDKYGAYVTGDLIQFYAGDPGSNSIDFDVEQPAGTHYRLSHSWSKRVTNETTIKSFLHGAAILGTMRRKGRTGRWMTSVTRSLFRSIGIPTQSPR